MPHRLLTLSLVVLLAVVSLTALSRPSQAQDAAPPATAPLEIILQDGSSLKGTVTSRSATEVAVRTEFGTLRIPTDQLSPASKQKIFAESPRDRAALVAQLEARIAALEAENRELRRRLAEAGTAPARPAAAAPLAPTPPGSARNLSATGDPGGLSYSISTTGKRHNSRCRYYNPKFPCAPSQGVACKVCGG
jgi:hypothetical protein